jgi:transglutaminase-like putative cysteine protease
MVYLHVDHPKLPIAVGVAFTVDRNEPRVLDPAPGAQISKAPDDIPTKLTSDRLVAVGARFHRIASKIAPDGEPPVDKERSFFDSIVRNMHYDYRKESPRYAQGDAAFMCDFKKGNCFDLHSYMVALSRGAGIPAVIEFGFPVATVPMMDPISADGYISGYHCWMWFEDDEGAQKRWVPVDVADARRWHDVYRSDVKNYLFGDLLLPRSAVAMSRGRDIVLNPPQKAKPLNYFVYPYAEAGGKSIPVGWKMQFHIVRVGIGHSGAAK